MYCLIWQINISFNWRCKYMLLLNNCFVYMTRTTSNILFVVSITYIIINKGPSRSAEYTAEVVGQLKLTSFNWPTPVVGQMKLEMSNLFFLVNCNISWMTSLLPALTNILSLVRIPPVREDMSPCHHDPFMSSSTHVRMTFVLDKWEVAALLKVLGILQIFFYKAQVTHLKSVIQGRNVKWHAHLPDLKFIDLWSLSGNVIS